MSKTRRQLVPRRGGEETNTLMRRKAGAMAHRLDRRKKTRGSRKRAAIKEQGYG